MTTYPRTCLSAAAFLTLAVGCFAATDAPVRFAGLVEGQETHELQGTPPSELIVDGSFTGTANTIGRFTLQYHLKVSLPAGSATGRGELKTPSGDTLFTTIAGVGVGVPGSPGLNSIVEMHTITGGTGRFAGAAGKFIVQRLANEPGWTAGSIWLPDAAKP